MLEARDGGDGHSGLACIGSSNDDLELENRCVLFGENTGVTGEVMSEEEELAVG